MKTTITARQLMHGNTVIDYPVVEIEDGYIRNIYSRDSGELSASSSVVQSFPEALLAPAYLDIHVHGAMGHDVMEGTPEALSSLEDFLLSRGVGGFFPTTTTSSVEQMLRVLDCVAARIEKRTSGSLQGAVPLGIHLEGPFLSHVRRGAHPAAYISPPSISLFEQFWQAARGHIRLLTIAPELPNALELIQYASVRGVRCSLGHSDATACEAEAGYRAGARSATHSFNAMRPLSHRDPGIIAFVLDNDALFAEIICDGRHVHPEIIRLFLKAKGYEKAILVSDGAPPMGMPDGTYSVAERTLEVKDGYCLYEGSLAGSICSLDQAVRNLVTYTSSSLSDSVFLASRNPARLMDVDDHWGSLDEKREANIVALSPTGEIQQVFRAGRAMF